MDIDCKYRMFDRTRFNIYEDDFLKFLEDIYEAGSDR
jgi:hypothetical protein